MASVNVLAQTKAFTHEGAKTTPCNAVETLKRTVMSCLLWEKQHYESGESTADRIARLVPQVDANECYSIAVDARTKSKLRHVPLLIARVMAKTPGHKALVANLLAEIIQRPDELTEFVSIYWKEGRAPLSAQVKKGLARAFKKFGSYSLAKYQRNTAVKLRDVMFLSHPKPDNAEQKAMWDKLVAGTLETPDTWEVELSKNGNSKEAWVRLLNENKLGGMALLRNLRNMQEKGVDKSSIRDAISKAKTGRVLPFRFLAAARYAPDLEPELEQAMYRCIADKEKISGRTAIMVDVSGSMTWPLSAKSEMVREDAANGLAILARELCEDIEVFSFSNGVAKVAPRRGFALRDAIHNSQAHGGTYLGKAIDIVQANTTFDRIIVLTDEQSADRVKAPNGKGYIINVSSYENGIGYGAWTHINGWSEAVLDFILESERNVD